MELFELDEPRKIYNKILQKEYLLKVYEAKSISTPISYEERVDKTPSNKAPFEWWVYKIDDLEKEIENLYEELSQKQECLIEKISKIENVDYQIILVLRYIKLKEWDLILDELKLSKSTILKRHKQGIKAFKKLK